ncbi:EamA family transporter [Chloroflexota bacterium]
MDYLILAIIAMVFMGIHYFLVRLISSRVTGPTVLLLSCLSFIPISAAYIYFTDIPFIPEQRIYLVYAFFVNILLTIGILSLYIAIQRGPLSAVMPIFGLNAVITAILGVLVLHEMVSWERALGIIFAMIAIVLLRR